MHLCVLGKEETVNDTIETVYIRPDNLKCSLDDAPSEILQIPVQMGCPGWLSATSSIRSCGDRASGSWEM